MSYIIHAWLPSKQQFNWGDVYSWFGEGNGTPLQYSCLENPMDGGAWYAAAHGVAELDMTERLHFHALEKEMATHSSVLAWRVPVMAEPGGLPSMGSHRVRHDWSDLAAAAFKLKIIFLLRKKISLDHHWQRGVDDFILSFNLIIILKSRLNFRSPDFYDHTFRVHCADNLWIIYCKKRKNLTHKAYTQDVV